VEASVSAAPWTATVLTLFPEMFPGPLACSLAGKALERDLWRLRAVDIRAAATDRHQSVDDTPFGGGAGMVMRPDVVARAVDTALADGAPGPLVYLSPRGAPLRQARVRELAQGPGVVLLCGRYEGVDARVVEARGFEELSLGDFVLSGGEIAAMALIDACVRLLPGVVGDRQSVEEESFADGLLEHPHYTRPQVWEGREVPEVLLSGHHERIRAWRRAQALEVTRERRPDLLAGSACSRL
jgi:tRNA (guanine37-N1)-methyltransferase